MTSNSRILTVAVACLFLIAAISGCDDRPEPGAAEAYDVVIAICNDKLESTQDFCDRIDSSTADSVWANVLFGRAAGHTATVEIETVEGGDAHVAYPPNRVPENRSWLHGVEIPRAGACSDVTCQVAVSALVDGQEVARESFTFVAQ